jgi:hypothetical protein
MKNITNKLNKVKEYARLSMRILRAKRSGKSQEIINQLIVEREAIKIRERKYNNNLFSDRKEADITKKYNNFGKTRNINQARIIVGTSDFKKLRLNNAIIVDKSLLIKAILESPSEVSLIARPRR